MKASVSIVDLRPLSLPCLHERKHEQVQGTDLLEVIAH